MAAWTSACLRTAPEFVDGNTGNGQCYGKGVLLGSAFALSHLYAKAGTLSMIAAHAIDDACGADDHAPINARRNTTSSDYVVTTAVAELHGVSPQAVCYVPYERVAAIPTAL